LRLQAVQQGQVGTAARDDEVKGPVLIELRQIGRLAGNVPAERAVTKPRTEERRGGLQPAGQVERGAAVIQHKPRGRKDLLKPRLIGRAPGPLRMVSE